MEPVRPVRPKALLAGAPDLSLVVPPTPESTETLAAFAREIQIVQTTFNQPKRSSLILPTFQIAEKRRGSVSFDKKPVQVVAPVPGEEEEVSEEEEEEEEEREEERSSECRREQLRLELKEGEVEEERRYPPTPPPRRRRRVVEDTPATPPSTPLGTPATSRVEERREHS